MQLLPILKALKPPTHIWMERSCAKYFRPHFKNEREKLGARRSSHDLVSQYNDFWTALDQLRGIKTRLHHWHFSLGTSYLSLLRFLKIWKFWSRKMPLCLYGAQARVPYRRKGIFWGQNFQIFKNLRNDRYDVPNEKCQWWSRVFMPLSWSRAVQKYVFRHFNGQNLRRGRSCSRSFLTWGGSYLELKLSIHILVRGFSALSIGRSCLFYLGVVKVEVIGQLSIWPITSTLTTLR